tara:strand:+ start:76 stop:333 length:258 start_codon:yes stop_codon:yes gene_type:complete
MVQDDNLVYDHLLRRQILGTDGKDKVVNYKEITGKHYNTTVPKAIEMDMRALTKSYYTALRRIAELIEENNDLKEKLKDANIHTS